MKAYSNWLVVVACLVGASSPADADIYKWVDERGVTTFSDRPPAQAQRVREVIHEVAAPAIAGDSDVQAEQGRAMRALNERVDRLTRELEAERRSRQETRAVLIANPKESGQGPTDGELDVPVLTAIPVLVRGGVHSRRPIHRSGSPKTSDLDLPRPVIEPLPPMHFARDDLAASRQYPRDHRR